MYYNISVTIQWITIISYLPLPSPIRRSFTSYKGYPSSVVRSNSCMSHTVNYNQLEYFNLLAFFPRESPKLSSSSGGGGGGCCRLIPFLTDANSANTTSSTLLS